MLDSDGNIERNMHLTETFAGRGIGSLAAELPTSYIPGRRKLVHLLGYVDRPLVGERAAHLGRI